MRNSARSVAVDEPSLVIHVTALPWQRIFATTAAMRERDAAGEREEQRENDGLHSKPLTIRGFFSVGVVGGQVH